MSDTTNINQPGPIDGLVAYVQNDIKPYHTKIIEVLVEYTVADPISVTVLDHMNLCIDLGQGTLNSTFIYNVAAILTTTVANDTIVITSPNPVMYPNGYIDVAPLFNVGLRVQLAASYSGDLTKTNDGYYFVKSVTLDMTNKRLLVQFYTGLPFPILPAYESGDVFIRNGSLGYVTVKVLNYCGDMYAASMSKVPTYECASTFGIEYDPQVPPDTIVTLDPDAPYAIIGQDPISNYFLVSGDQRAYFPYAREFTITGSHQNDGTYDTLYALLDVNGNTTVFTTQNVLFPFPNVVTNGVINTPGMIGSQFQYGFGYDLPRLCSVVPELHAQIIFDEQLVIVITDTASETILGWDDFPWEANTWDTNLPNSGAGADVSVGFDPIPDGFDSGFDPS